MGKCKAVRGWNPSRFRGWDLGRRAYRSLGWVLQRWALAWPRVSAQGPAEGLL